MKSTSKTIATLLALILLLNPLQVFARALFLNSSFAHEASLMANGDTEVLISTAWGQAMPENCHEDMQTLTDADLSGQAEALSAPRNMHADMTHSIRVKSVASSDCCIHDCSCNDSVCHSVSLVFSPNVFRYAHFSQQYDFNLSFYISLASGPASPPPIV